MVSKMKFRRIISSGEKSRVPLGVDGFWAIKSAQSYGNARLNGTQIGRIKRIFTDLFDGFQSGFGHPKLIGHFGLDDSIFHTKPDGAVMEIHFRFIAHQFALTIHVR